MGEGQYWSAVVFGWAVAGISAIVLLAPLGLIIVGWFR